MEGPGWPAWLIVALLLAPGGSVAGPHLRPPPLAAPQPPTGPALLEEAQRSLAEDPAAGSPAGWSELASSSGPSPRWGETLVYNPGDAYLLLFGGTNGTAFFNDTWEYVWTNGGGTWTQKHPEPAPAPRAFASAVYDPALGAVVLFGGWGPSGDLNDTWTLAGDSWTHLSGAAPSPRAGAGLAVDASSGSLVLFGGSNETGYLSDVWRLSRTSWQTVAVPAGPIGRANATFVEDPALGAVLLSGGSDSSGALGDSWTFNGSAWSSVASTSYVAGEMASAYDPADDLLLEAGGLNVTGALAAEWGFSVERTWSALESPKAPSGRYGAAATFDDQLGSIVLFGGERGHLPLGDLWSFSLSDGPTSWQAIATSATPPARTGAAMAFDPATGDVVLFGGEAGNETSGLYNLTSSGSGGGTWLNDTWLFQKDQWTELDEPIAPSPRAGAALAFDAYDGELLLFGGTNGTSYLGDSWAFANGRWTPVASPTGPSPRAWAAMTYDAGDGYLVLFGGYGGPGVGTHGYLGDTWTFQAGAWRADRAAPQPSPRALGQLAYDPGAGLVLLFGGQSEPGNASGPQTLSDTWHFDGGIWTNQTRVNASAPPESAGSLVFDPRDGSLVLFGGLNGSSRAAGAWTLRNPFWTRLCEACLSPSPSGTPALFDPGASGLLDVAPGPSASSDLTTELNLTQLAVAASVPSWIVGPPLNLTALAYGGQEPVAYLWHLWDGRNLHGPEISLTFHVTGNYSVLLNVTDAGGRAISLPLVVPVLGAPTVSLAAEPWGPSSWTDRLVATVVGGAAPYTFTWSFGDANTSSGSSASVLHTYASAGSYVAHVALVDAFGETASSANVTVTVPNLPLSVTLTSSRTAGIVPFNVPLSASLQGGYGVATFNWTVRENPTASFYFLTTTPNATLRFDQNATWTVTVKVRETGNFSDTSNALTLRAAPNITLRWGADYHPVSLCPFTSGQTRVTLWANASGGTGAPYEYQWTAAGHTLPGKFVNVTVAAGDHLVANLVTQDSGGDLNFTNYTVTVPSEGCSLAGYPGGILFLDGVTLGSVLVVMSVAFLLLRRRRRRRAAASTPGTSSSSSEPPSTSAPPPTANR